MTYIFLIQHKAFGKTLLPGPHDEHLYGLLDANDSIYERAATLRNRLLFRVHDVHTYGTSFSVDISFERWTFSNDVS